MMGLSSPWHLLAIVAVAAIVFGGKGKLSSVMGDAAKGIKSFRDGLKGEDPVDHKPAAPGALPIESTLERQASDAPPR